MPEMPAEMPADASARTSSAFEVLRPDAPGPVLLVCDHASNRVPPEIGGGSLGLSEEDMGRHIAFDVGAAGVTRRLSALLDAPAVLSNFSRLVIDPNRGEDDPTLVMRLSDGSIVPENRRIDRAEIERRTAAYYRPYDQAIAAQIAALQAQGTVPHLISIHSFTPHFRGRAPRPWHVGVLWDQDGRLARPLMARFEAPGDLVVGDNEPYTGQLSGDTMWRHGTQKGLPHVLIEVRNDLIADSPGEAAWARRLAEAIDGLVPVV